VTTTTVDLGPLVQIVISFLGVVLPLIAGYIAWLIKQRMNIQQDSADALKIDTAAKRAGGIALDFINKVMPANPTVDVRNAGIAQGLNHVMASLPDTVARMGVTPDTLTRMVTSELTQLETPAPVAVVATDPPATAGKPLDPPAAVPFLRRDPPPFVPPTPAPEPSFTPVRTPLS
jgi:hypothetical protein